MRVVDLVVGLLWLTVYVLGCLLLLVLIDHWVLGLGFFLRLASLGVLLAGAALRPALAVFTALAAALIIFAHRSNISRLMTGTENRFERARLVSWGRRK